jgi:hypothetical protein
MGVRGEYIMQKTKVAIWVVTLLALATAALAKYNATYGKVDNMEMGFDIMWDTAVGVAPWVLFVLGGLGLAWLLNKSGLFKWD